MADVAEVAFEAEVAIKRVKMQRIISFAKCNHAILHPHLIRTCEGEWPLRECVNHRSGRATTGDLSGSCPYLHLKRISVTATPVDPAPRERVRRR